MASTVLAGALQLNHSDEMCSEVDEESSSLPLDLCLACEMAEEVMWKTSIFVLDFLVQNSMLPKSGSSFLS